MKTKIFYLIMISLALWQPLWGKRSVALASPFKIALKNPFARKKTINLPVKKFTQKTPQNLHAKWGKKEAAIIASAAMVATAVGGTILFFVTRKNPLSRQNSNPRINPQQRRLQNASPLTREQSESKPNSQATKQEAPLASGNQALRVPPVESATEQQKSSIESKSVSNELQKKNSPKPLPIEPSIVDKFKEFCKKNNITPSIKEEFANQEEIDATLLQMDQLKEKGSIGLDAMGVENRDATQSLLHAPNAKPIQFSQIPACDRIEFPILKNKKTIDLASLTSTNDYFTEWAKENPYLQLPSIQKKIATATEESVLQQVSNFGKEQVQLSSGDILGIEKDMGDDEEDEAKAASNQAKLNDEIDKAYAAIEQAARKGEISPAALAIAKNAYQKLTLDPYLGLPHFKQALERDPNMRKFFDKKTRENELDLARRYPEIIANIDRSRLNTIAENEKKELEAQLKALEKELEEATLAENSQSQETSSIDAQLNAAKEKIAQSDTASLGNMLNEMIAGGSPLNNPSTNPKKTTNRAGFSRSIAKVRDRLATLPDTKKYIDSHVLDVKRSTVDSYESPSTQNRVVKILTEAQQQLYLTYGIGNEKETIYYHRPKQRKKHH